MAGMSGPGLRAIPGLLVLGALAGAEVRIRASDPCACAGQESSFHVSDDVTKTSDSIYDVRRDLEALQRKCAFVQVRSTPNSVESQSSSPDPIGTQTQEAKEEGQAAQATINVEDLEAVFPCPTNGSWEPTEAGQAALQKGRAIYHESGNRGFSDNPPPSKKDLRDMGGQEALLLWFGAHYRRMFADPRMSVLFNTAEEESNVSAALHGRRLGLALLSRWTGNREYFELTNSRNMFQRLEEAHQRAKRCPFRHSRLQGKGFTVDQRDSWLGHLWLAGTECGMKVAQCDVLVRHLASVIGVYAPFVRAPDDIA